MSKNITFFLSKISAKYKAFVLVAFCMLAFFCYGAFIKAETVDANTGKHVANEVLIKLKNSANVFKYSYSEQDKDIEEIIEDLNKLPAVEYSEPNYIYQASIIPSDTYYGNQWYLKKIQAEQAWDKTQGSRDIVIAIIDSGVQIDHPDLKDNIWINKKEIANNGIDDDDNGFIDDVNGWDFVNKNNDPKPKFKPGFTRDGILHGTIIAGIAAAAGNNASGIAGVSWNAQIMSLKALDDSGSGDTNNVVRAIDYAINNEAHIINLSFVGSGNSQSLASAIRRAYNAGVIIIAAAGNETSEEGGELLDNTPLYPVCHDGNLEENMIIGVAATDALDQKTDFSGFGSKCIDIAAPGISIYGTVVHSPENNTKDAKFNNYYEGYWSGTSMAVPVVSGSAALVLSANPTLNNDDVIRIIRTTTDNISRLNPEYIGKLGTGRINAYQAVSMALREKTADKYSILVVPASQNPPQIDIVDTKGKKSNSFFAYDKAFRGGVNVASGDIDGDGVDEIITGAGPSGGPHVRIFKANGDLVSHFFAYDKAFRGGVNVAVAEMSNGSRLKKAEIITSPGLGGGPHIKIFTNKGEIIGGFFAYDKNFKGGVAIASADFDGNGVDEIITGAGPSGGPHVRVFNAKSKLLYSFYAYDPKFSGGVKVNGFKYE